MRGPVVFALNRLDAYTLLQAFGQHPRKQPEPVQEALARIWISTLYGAEWLGKSPRISFANESTAEEDMTQSNRMRKGQ